jgi:hypothetical protein
LPIQALSSNRQAIVKVSHTCSVVSVNLMGQLEGGLLLRENDQ